MRFLLDENMDYRLAPFLEQLGHDVTAISVNYPHGLPDDEVLTLAHKEQRILITNDTGDFGALIFQQHFPHTGVILFRLKAEQANIKLRKLAFGQSQTKGPPSCEGRPNRVKFRSSRAKEVYSFARHYHIETISS